MSIQYYMAEWHIHTNTIVYDRIICSILHDRIIYYMAELYI